MAQTGIKRAAKNKTLMTQAQIINYFAEKWQYPKAQVKRMLIEDFYDLAVKEIQRCGGFVLPNIGKIVVSNRKARVGRNPQTGETLQIPAKRTLKARLNKGFRDEVLPQATTAARSAASGR